MENNLKQKNDLIESQQKYIDELIIKMSEMEDRAKDVKINEEKMREKDVELVKLNKVTERLKSINKELNKELKTNERKVRDL